MPTEQKPFFLLWIVIPLVVFLIITIALGGTETAMVYGIPGGIELLFMYFIFKENVWNKTIKMAWYSSLLGAFVLVGGTILGIVFNAGWVVLGIFGIGGIFILLGGIGFPLGYLLRNKIN